MNSRHQGFKQNLGLIGAICGSLIVSLPAIAQVRSPDPSSINTGDFERICSEYRNQNQNQARMQNNRTPASSSSGDVVRRTDATNRVGSTGSTTSSNSGTTSRRSSTSAGVTNPPGSADNPTGGNLGTAISRGDTASDNTGTTSDRANTASGTTDRATSSDRTVSGNSDTTTSSDREGYGSYSAEELERLCADYMNNSDTNRNSPSGTQRRNNPQTSPNNPSNPTTSPSGQRRSSRIVPTPEQQQAASARINPVNGRIAVRLVNETGANITYQIIGDSNERSLPGESAITLQTLLTPTTITFYRPDYGLLMARPRTTAQPGVLEVRFAATTDLGMDKNALTVEPTGAVFLN